MLNALVKVAVGASLFTIGKALASRDSIVRINGNEVSGDKKELVGAAMALGGIVMTVTAIGRLLD